MTDLQRKKEESTNGEGRQQTNDNIDTVTSGAHHEEHCMFSKHSPNSSPVPCGAVLG